MKFKHGTRRRALEYEKDWVQRWKENKTFEKSVENRPKDDAYVFYDGPPFITGVPHHGTLLSSIVKDAIPRYQTMKGKHVERVWGWDCHGLPAENFVEKKLGIQDRHEIGTKISLADYITTARESMVQTSSLWEDTIDRIVSRWSDGYRRQAAPLIARLKELLGQGLSIQQAVNQALCIVRRFLRQDDAQTVVQLVEGASASAPAAIRLIPIDGFQHLVCIPVIPQDGQHFV